MRTLYEFVGGEYHGMRLTREFLDVIGNGKFTEDMTELREKGVLVHRAELDNQPKVNSYCGPMWGGIRYEINGKFKYDFECTEDEKAKNEPVQFLRYETQEVYDMLSR